VYELTSYLRREQELLVELTSGQVDE